MNRSFWYFIILVFLIALFLAQQERFNEANNSSCLENTTNECALDDSICYTRGYGQCKYLNTSFRCPEGAVYFQNCQGKFLAAKPGHHVYFADKPNEDCCFQIVKPLYEIKLNKSHSIESTRYPGHFLRHQGFVLKLHRPLSVRAPYQLRLDYLFRFSQPAHDKNHKSAVYILPTQANFKGSCFYSDSKTVRFRARQCPDNEHYRQHATFYVGSVSNMTPYMCGSTRDCLTACPMDDSCFACDGQGIYFRNCQGKFLSVTPYSKGRVATFADQPDVSCCFKVTESPHGVKIKGAHALESVAYPEHYLRHSGYRIRLDKSTAFAHNAHLKRDFMFFLAQGMTGDPNTVTLMPVQSAFGRACFYHHDNQLRFRSRHCPRAPEFNNRATLYTCKGASLGQYQCGTVEQCQQAARPPPRVGCHSLAGRKRIVTDFDCGRSSQTLKNAIPHRDNFTLSLNLYVYDNFRTGWNHILHGGDYHSRHRTPGVWVYGDGRLHIRGSTSANWNDGGSGCWRAGNPLSRGQRYHIIIVYSRRNIAVYRNGQLVKNCPLSGNLKPARDLYLGKTNFSGAPVIATIDYLPRALSGSQVAQCHSQLNKTKQIRQQTRSDQYRYERGACRQDGNPRLGRWTRRGYRTIRDCQQLCDRDARCTAFHYARPRGNKYDCYLMYNPRNRGIQFHNCMPRHDCWCAIKTKQPKTASIEVLEASYGPNCGVRRGNVTDKLKRACDGKTRCNYHVNHRVIGDPAYGCRKTFEVRYKCGNQVKRAHAPREASGRRVTLSC